MTYQPEGDTRPHSIDAEEGLLGSVLINPSCLHDEGISEVMPGDFWVQRNGKIWECYQDLDKRGMQIDYLTVQNYLENCGDLMGVGGAAYVMGLINQTPTSLHAGTYARIIIDFADRRRSLDTMSELAKRVYDTQQPITDSIGWAIDNLSRPVRGSRPITDIVDAALEFRGMLRDPKAFDAIDPGIPNLRKAMGGYLKKTITVVGARTGKGKTDWEIQLMRITAKRKKRGLYISNELKKHEIWMRIACGAAGIDSRRLTSQGFDGIEPLTEAELQEIENHSDALMNLYADWFWIEDQDWSKENVRRLCAKIKPDLLIYDHLDENEARSNEERMNTIRVTTNWLREFADTYNMNVQAVHQLNRANTTGATTGGKPKTRPPLLTDLAWSDDIAKMADQVLLLHHKNDDDEDTPKPQKGWLDYEVWIRKNRNGPSDVPVALKYNPLRHWFTDEKNPDSANWK